MENQRRLFIFPTGRAIRAFESRHGDGILPKLMRAESFFESAIIVPERSSIPNTLRMALLHEACMSVDLERLGFARHFLDFLEHSEFLFLFFSELRGECVSISDLVSQDVYADFEDHLEILNHVYNAYKSLLEKKGFYDQTVLEEYRLNTPFLQQYSACGYFLEGSLTRFEKQILRDVSEWMPVTIETELTAYSQNLRDKLSHSDLDLAATGHYRIDLTHNTLIDYSPSAPLPQIDYAGFSSRIKQVSFIFQKIHFFLNESGYLPEEIAIVLPDETFVAHLHLFDAHRNLNYAMGTSVSSTDVYKRLESLMAYLKARNQEEARDEEPPFPDQQILFCETGFEAFGRFLDSFEISDSTLMPIMDDCRFELEKLCLHFEQKPFIEYLALYLQMLGKSRIDDVSGGRIKVMGVLESRQIRFKAVIIPDMNEGIVPKASEKDIFLSSSIRARSGLPTRKEREQLQKHYYYRLLQNCEQAALCYVQNDESQPSRFLSEIGLDFQPVQDHRFDTVVFRSTTHKTHWDDTIEGRIDLSIPMSHTRFKDFLECKRRFWYKYVKRLREPELQGQTKPYEVGHHVHTALNTLYSESIPTDLDSFHFRLRKLLISPSQNDDVLQFDLNLFLANATAFMENELVRFQNGISIVALEKPFLFEYGGITWKGQIDRIDRLQQGLAVLDYKIKDSIRIDSPRTVEKTADFQLEIYALAVKTLYPDSEIASAAFYDVRKGQILEETLLEEKTGMLDEKIALLKEQSILFEKQDSNPALCRNCPYSTLCDRH